MSDDHQPGTDGGPPPGGPVEGVYRSQVGGIRFEATEHVGRMSRIADRVAEAGVRVPEFHEALVEAGDLTVRFRPARGHGAAHWNAITREVVVDPLHAEVRDDAERLTGVALFAILDAAAEGERRGWEQYTQPGYADYIDVWAGREGMTAARYYAREMERIDFDNVRRHRRITAALGRAGTGADHLRDLPGDFDAFWALRCRPGGAGEAPHVASYERRYTALRPDPVTAPEIR
ncbi:MULTISPECIES: hypothetical protein [Streptomyces]|uniref:Uncharacterized protein n=1 Tax=Streptomyces doudnae TaxID=3075536 RepID=A0ABD5EH51_9ACTN|nr:MULTISPECIES: hypothetical protein [unclassified Streptomyces]MDT0433623.1 hypothetical protein [Streptomyces sp. DSM 41981]MYQ64084.1 hypothetical protein [Streptomyces sp. SID4950]SCD71391.1 hypothetical protein GA0115242_112519 [Streptomyces sp. SolWspMP-5a-2]